MEKSLQLHKERILDAEVHVGNDVFVNSSKGAYQCGIVKLLEIERKLHDRIEVDGAEKIKRRLDVCWVWMHLKVK